MAANRTPETVSTMVQEVVGHIPGGLTSIEVAGSLLSSNVGDPLRQAVLNLYNAHPNNVFIQYSTINQEKRARGLLSTLLPAVPTIVSQGRTDGALRFAPVGSYHMHGCMLVGDPSHSDGISKYVLDRDGLVLALSNIDWPQQQ